MADWKDIAGRVIAAGAPTLGEMLGSALPLPGGATIGRWAGERLAEALGVEPTPEAVNNALTTAPAATVQAAIATSEGEAVAKWTAIAELAKQEAVQRVAEIADVQDARQVQKDLSEKQSIFAWGPPVIGVMVVALFSIVMVIWVFFPPQGNQAAMTTLNVMVGVLGSSMQQVVSYYLGSSAGSRDKSTAIEALAVSMSKPTPPPPVVVTKK